MMIQRLLIRWLLEPLGSLMDHFSEKSKEIAFRISGLAMVLIYLLYVSGLNNIRFLYVFVLDCACLGVMILCTLKREISCLQFDWKKTVPWMGVGLFAFLSGVLYTVDRLPEAVLFLAAFPILFIAWNNYGFEKILNMLMDICIMSFVGYFIVTALFFPVSEVRYYGSFTNPNAAGGYLAITFVCCLMRILMHARTNWKKCAGYALLAGLDFALVFYTGSRAGQIVAVGTLVFGLILHMLLYLKTQFKATLRAVIMLTVSILIFFNSAIYIFQWRSLLPGATPEQAEPVVATEVPVEETVEMPIETTAETPTETTGGASALLNTSEMLNSAQSRYTFAGKNLDEITTGRATVWAAYFSELNLFGHAEPLAVHVSVPSIHLDEIVSTAHMTILQIAYNSGIFAGICYLIYNLLSGISSIKFAFTNRESVYAIVPFALTIAFGINSLFESMTPSFLYFPALIYHLTQFCLIGKIRKTEKSF